MHQYSIDSILAWFKDGIIWWVLSWTPLRNLVTVPNDPPPWWYSWWGYWDWSNGSDNNWHPYPELGERMMAGCFRLLESFIYETAAWLSSSALATISNIIGGLPAQIVSIVAWVQSVVNRLGEGYVSWAYSVVDAVQRLYNWLPEQVRFGGMSWGSLFYTVQDTVWNWVTGRYEEARNIAFSWRDWLGQWGNQLRDWYQKSRDLLENIRANPAGFVRAQLGSAWSVLESLAGNPAGFITSRLGDTWARLSQFAHDSLTFYYNLWSAHARDLSEFLSDPGAWIVEKIRAEIERIW